MQFQKIFLAIGLLNFVGCSLYQSAGRKAFEYNAPLNMSNGNIGAGIQAQTNTACWSQPWDEPLWASEPQVSYHVQRVDSDHIEVCVENSQN